MERCDAFRFYRVRGGSWFGSVTVLSEIYTGDGRTQLEAVVKALDKATLGKEGINPCPTNEPRQPARRSTG